MQIDPTGVVPFAGLSAWSLFVTAVAILAALWVHRDATARAVAAPWAWSIATMFNVFVALLYFILRRTNEGSSTA